MFKALYHWPWSRDVDLLQVLRSVLHNAHESCRCLPLSGTLVAIRQRRRMWKRRVASFHFLSRLSQGAQLFKRRDFGLELKRWARARVQTDMVEFITLPFPFPCKYSPTSFKRPPSIKRPLSKVPIYLSVNCSIWYLCSTATFLLSQVYYLYGFSPPLSGQQMNFLWNILS